jgi:glutamate racemase
VDLRPIGVFDSGVGGLTVVKEIVAAMPNERVIYFGDTARVPYGSKTKETVTKFSAQIINFLLKFDVKAVVIACNTASSNSYESLSKMFNVPIIEVITPGVIAGLAATKTGRVGVIGTEATIRSNAYAVKIKDERASAEVFQAACPLFVPLSEEGFIEPDNQITSLVAQKYLQPLINNKIDTLILGCTHYPLIEACIKNVVGDTIMIVNPARETAAQTKRFLENNGLDNGIGFAENNGIESRVFYVSDYSPKFSRICETLLGKVYLPEIIDIENVIA